MEYLLIRSLSVFFQLVNLLLVIRVVLSWARYNPYNKYITLLFNVTEPILEPFRKLLNRLNVNFEMVDLSPLVAMLCIQYIIQPLTYTLIRLFL
ncbi:MAG TPA: YggT family protein [Patescibacteria group bacterium]|nr:YggT family protein [Patescibacteria group bacterium]